MLNRITIILTLVLFVGISFTADKTSAEANEIPFTVNPILPLNQDRNIDGYVSIQSKEDHLKQKLEFKLENKSKTVQEIEISVVDGYTSPNGVIQYITKGSENSQIINEKYKLSKHLKYKDKTVKLEKGESRTVAVYLDSSDMEGMLLGGVSFKALQDEEEGDDSSFQISNEINMVVGVLVNFKESQTPEFSIDSPFIDPMPSYFAVRLPVSLNSASLIQDADLVYTVSKDDIELFKGSRTSSFAPFTKANISIPFEHNEIKEKQQYNIKGKIVYKDKNGKTIEKEFDENFKYDKGEASKQENRMLQPPTEEVNGFSSYLALALLFLAALVAFVVLRLKRKKK